MPIDPIPTPPPIPIPPIEVPEPSGPIEPPSDGLG